MFIRRLAASACALGLIIPAAAGAQQADHIFPQPAPEKTHTVYGDSHYDLQNKQELGVTAVTKGGWSKTDVDKMSALSTEQLAAAHGIGRPTATPVAKPVSVSSQDNGTDGWRTAAIAEAGLLAAFVAACGVALSRVSPRRRTPGLGV